MREFAMTSVIEKKKYTYEDYVKISEDKRYELIDGELLMTPSPITRHQRISRKIEFMLEKFIVENNLGEVFDAPYDVYLDETNVVQPDILFVSKDRLNIIGEKNIQGAPDLVIEIVSENSAYRDIVLKKGLYARFGVKEYWIVIPETEEIEIYILEENHYQIFKAFMKNESLKSPILKGLKMELKNIF
ncbi:MAG: Uma2 family endonuclease [Candidatus Kuenenia sp.]|nr:Uma2 family endonuclease [Candidatus Kuenenia hertensis]